MNIEPESMALSDQINLLIDAGNSRLKWALYRRGQLESGSSIVYQPSEGRSQDSVLASQLTVSWQSLVGTEYNLHQIILSNVAGTWIMDAINQWISAHLDKGLSVKDASSMTIDNVVAQGNAYGVINAYTQPERLGSDRWASLIAARHLVPGDCCIIDCGSALTIDVLTHNGEHLGGTISPGWWMMKESLIAKTNAINEDDLKGEMIKSPQFGRNTQEAIDAGVTASCVGAIDHVVQHYQEETGSKVYCVVTGGDAQKILPWLDQHNSKVEFHYEPDWVLKGLAIISDGMATEKNIGDPGDIK